MSSELPDSREPSALRRPRRWRVVRLASGWVLIGVGIVGLVLPILQGVALILAGLALLAPDTPWAKRCLRWLRRRVRKLRGMPDQDGAASGG